MHVPAQKYPGGDLDAELRSRIGRCEEKQMMQRRPVHFCTVGRGFESHAALVGNPLNLSVPNNSSSKDVAGTNYLD